MPLAHACTHASAPLPHLLGPRHEDALENAGQVADVKFVLEVDRCLAEGGGHALVQHQRRLHDFLPRLGRLRAERLQVAAQEGRVDGVQALGRREVDRKRREEALEARVDGEGAGGGVHRCEVLRIEQHFWRHLGQVSDVAVAHVLPHERDVGGSVVLVEHCHVQVVDEVDQLLPARRAVILPRLLLERRFKNALQG
eukprot:3713743-Pleurochrysis_carterae.AAC.3